MPKRPKDVINGIRVSHTVARRSIEIVLREFSLSLKEELIKEAPQDIKHLIEKWFEVVFVMQEQSGIGEYGWSLILKNNRHPGKVIAIWNFGSPVSHLVTPSHAKALRFKETTKAPNGSFRAWTHTPIIPPSKFIQRAWRRVTQRYLTRVKRAISASFQGKIDVS